MSTYGITPNFADMQLAAAVSNTPLAVPITCLQLHNGAPGTGTSNVSAVTAREQVVMNTPINGATSLAGGSPSYNMTTAETIEGGSLWSGFDGDASAYAMYTLVANPPVTVAQGDILVVSSITLTQTGMAS